MPIYVFECMAIVLSIVACANGVYASDVMSHNVKTASEFFTHSNNHNSIALQLIFALFLLRQ